MCKSKEKMTKYGFRLDDANSNKDLYIKVFHKYMCNENVSDIWIIDKIHDIVDSLEYSLKIIEEISRKSECMVFWYGEEYEELDRINSSQELIDYLADNMDDSCLEIYLFVDLVSNC